MLSLYRAGDSLWHRLPAGPKALLLMVIVLGVGLLPVSRPGPAVAAVIAVGCYAVPGVGLRELGRQLVAVRWAILVTAAGQLLFLGPERAAANTTRVGAALVIGALIALTTPVGALLDALEQGLKPLDRIGIDRQRVALLLIVTITMLPVLARLAHDVREAQRARGAPPGLRHFALPFLVVALKHADALGDALSARGVR
ncbi:energy-coupling factor transporter transmembrane protein EcfT [Kineosporia sp. NBRC 101731]|uniref:energy-coupling factor transporter transmembrane component T family protein n=1 Tax=Kineosporia sp. NBRC 101731 TaxID=3032199 RepID=UPI0024A51765|nr:energy-coupling factor transporter transmembrane protein EcfT [Kineosporia sp. NBRC 101731]GLY29265.1 cobalt ABC transporter permease [Kineosporia sp. NBRC 101731]